MKGGKTERGKRKGNHEDAPSFFCMASSTGKGRMLTMRMCSKVTLNTNKTFHSFLGRWRVLLQSPKDKLKGVPTFPAAMYPPYTACTPQNPVSLNPVSALES